MPEPAITVTLKRGELEAVCIAAENNFASTGPLRAEESGVAKLRAALTQPQPERYTAEEFKERFLAELEKARQWAVYGSNAPGDGMSEREMLEGVSVVEVAGVNAALSAAFPDQQPVEEEDAGYEEHGCGGTGTADPASCPHGCPDCTSPPQPEQPVEDNAERCKRCGSGNAIWSASSPLWNAVIASAFHVVADQVNLELETTTPSGRVWDEGRRLWVAQQPEQEGEAGDWPGEAITHELKCWPPYFEDILSGRKNFEVRVADRPFREGDLLLLREYDPDQPDPAKRYTGRSLSRQITYTLFGNQFGIKPGHVALALGGAPAQHPTGLSEGDRERVKQAFSLLWASHNKGPAVKAEAIDSAIDLLRRLANQQGRD